MGSLSASRCPACGRLATPPEPYGCEGCGAPAGTLESTELVAAGSVRATAMVHRHHKPDPATPFTVVEVVLDGGGPALKGVLAPGLDPPAIGERVSGAVLDGRLIWEREG
ncbi:MAG: hypothetical protein IT196_25870 [Acidimicrobiales bacterium]|nr:hypothetical protein [Acidimicrobiales bacterium]